MAQVLRAPVERVNGPQVLPAHAPELGVIHSLPPAFVLGLGSGGLGAVRSLGRHGVKVTGLYADAADPGRKSSHGIAVRCPDPETAPASFINFLVDTGRRLSKRAVLMASTDAFLLAICENRERLNPYFDFSAPGEATIRSVVDKQLQCEIAAQAGLTVPPTVYIDDAGNCDRSLHDLPYPAILKPCIGHLWKRKGIVVHSEAEAVAAIRAARQPGVRLLLQSFIEGPVTHLYSVGLHLSRSGRLVSFPVRKLRQTSRDAGVGTAIETVSGAVPLPPLDAFLEQLDYRGLGEIEFKFDPKDGAFKFIEFNPRIWQQVSFGNAAGIDFPWIAYCDIVGLPLDLHITPPATPLRWIDLFLDLEPAFRDLQAGRLSLKAWLGTALRSDSRPFFAWDDLRPFALHATGWVRLLARRRLALLRKRQGRN